MADNVTNVPYTHLQIVVSLTYISYARVKEQHDETNVV